jgi:hypothetical protein
LHTLTLTGDELNKSGANMREGVRVSEMIFAAMIAAPH